MRVIYTEPSAKIRVVYSDFSESLINSRSRDFRVSETNISRAIRIEANLAGQRIDKAAALLLPEFSRTQLVEWVRDGSLTLDGRVVPAKQRVFGGEALVLNALPPVQARWDAPQAVAFARVYEDDALLVVDKPSGVVVHPGAGNPDHTLVNGLLRVLPELAALPRAGIVHRLDKDTSGLLVVAKTTTALRRLTRALSQHDVTRRYRAVVEGVLTGGRTIDAPIGRDPSNRLRQRVTSIGRPASTRVHSIERYRAHCLVTAELATGRTHQIRVHLSSVGHPLVGDRRYGARGRLPARPSVELLEAIRGFRRQALHAAELSFAHPITAAQLSFESALPDDLAGLIAALARDRADAQESEPRR
jgi:23S rRNA pseudouridine1911/1915/1917 synthase